MKKLFICDVVVLVLSVLGMYVMYALNTECVYYITFNIYNKYIYTINIMHAFAYIALGCMCLLIITPVIVAIKETCRRKNK